MAFPASEELVAQAERELGRDLPDELRRRLIENNGGEIAVVPWPDVWSLYPVRDDTDRRRLARTASHIVRQHTELAELREAGDLPDDAIAIAENAGGDLLLRLASESFAVWDHETAELDEDVSVTWTTPGS